MKVLIVEDEIFAALHLESLVEELGGKVVGIAPDSEAALEIGAARPDLAVVDLNLRDGFTGCEIARELATRYGTKVLFLTANPRQADIQIEGVVGVVSKPFDEATLRDTIRATVGREGA